MSKMIWEKTKTQFLLRDKISGRYYCRFFKDGKHCKAAERVPDLGKRHENLNKLGAIWQWNASRGKCERRQDNNRRIPNGARRLFRIEDASKSVSEGFVFSPF